MIASEGGRRSGRPLCRSLARHLTPQARAARTKRATWAGLCLRARREHRRSECAVDGCTEVSTARHQPRRVDLLSALAITEPGGGSASPPSEAGPIAEIGDAIDRLGSTAMACGGAASRATRGGRHATSISNPWSPGAGRNATGVRRAPKTQRHFASEERRGIERS